MKSSSRSQSTKSFRYRAIGTLLLVMPLCGITSQLPIAQAQPVQIPPTTINSIGPEQKAVVKKIMATARRERVLKTLVDIKVENASLEDVTSRLEKMFPKANLSFDVRTKNPVRVSFDLKQARVGDLLNNVAGLAGSKLYVLSDGLVIADKSALTQSQLAEIGLMEGGEWAQSSEAGGKGWSNMRTGNLALSLAVAQEVMGDGEEAVPTGVVKTTLGKFSPESQEILQEIAAYLNSQAPDPSFFIQLNASSAVTVDSANSKSITIGFPPDTSHPSNRTIVLRHVLGG